MYINVCQLFVYINAHYCCDIFGVLHGSDEVYNKRKRKQQYTSVLFNFIIIQSVVILIIN